MTDAVCIVVFIMMVLTFGIGVIVGECLAIDSIADGRQSKREKRMKQEGKVSF